MDNNTTYNIDDLLVKYLLEEADAAERKQVDSWVQQHEENRRYFNHFRLIWTESRKLETVSAVDEHIAWKQFLQKIERPGGAKVIGLKKKWARAGMAAAVLAGIIITAIAYWIINDRKVGEVTVVQSGGATRTDSLADGSFVTLNKNSSIVYDKKLEGDTRHVSLTGEAFFNVAPDKNKPFVIAINDITIKVVGTSFNVKDVQGNTEVIVESGVVEVVRRSEAIALKANEKILVEKSQAQMRKDSSHGKLYNYYRTKTFVCDNTPLWQLVATLNEAYGENIVIENSSIRHLPLTVTFNKEPLSNILSIITATLNITAEKKDNRIVLR